MEKLKKFMKKIGKKMTHKKIEGKYGEQINRHSKGLYLLSHADLLEDVYAIREKMRRIQLELDRLIKLIERVKEKEIKDE